MTIAAWGLVLDALGAVLIAVGQLHISATLELWLTAPERTVQSVSGMKDAVRFNRRMSAVGWALFVIGIALQVAETFPATRVR